MEMGTGNAGIGRLALYHTCGFRIVGRRWLDDEMKTRPAIPAFGPGPVEESDRGLLSLSASLVVFCGDGVSPLFLTIAENCISQGVC